MELDPDAGIIAGDGLKSMRTYKRISQQKTADFIGVSVPTLRKWERNKQVNVKYLEKIAELFPGWIADNGDNSPLELGE